MKIKEILKFGIEELQKSNIENYNIKAKMILAHVLNKEKEYLLIHDEEIVSEELYNDFINKIQRLKMNEPIQYILNNQEFMGIQFFVNENVLIPQPDTENLVEEVLNIINSKNECVILDLCTGSGAIAVSLSKYIANKKIEIYASDISEEALVVANKNAINNGANIKFIKSNLFEDMDEEVKFDIIVSNPPYIETRTIDKLSEEVRKEPILALDGGEDGLKFYKKIIKEAKKYLNKDGILAFEIGYNQKVAVEELLKENYYRNIYSKKDLAGNDRIVVGQL